MPNPALRRACCIAKPARLLISHVRSVHVSQVNHVLHKFTSHVTLPHKTACKAGCGLTRTAAGRLARIPQG